ncbi:MAG: hypothetical protein EBR09_12155 [Proteobacteria bacterium]|nr:hypothetical protein [Pseudomonadota bacterium]
MSLLKVLPVQIRLLLLCSLWLAAAGCGQDRQTHMVQLAETDSPTKEEKVSDKPDAGLYTEFYTRNPLTTLKPFSPQPLFYSLHYNCNSCHEFTRRLEEIIPKLKKNRPQMSIQDLIASGSMPPNNQNFAKSAEGRDLLRMLNAL